MIKKALVFSFLASAIVFSYANEVKIESNAFVQLEKEVAGKKIIDLVPAKSVLPGQTILFKNSIFNGLQKPATNLELVNPIPQNMTFVSSPLVEQTEVLFSVDGKVFKQADKLMVTDKNTKQARLANKEEYTHIKWVVKGILEPQKSIDVTFLGVVK